jgi:two-component system chemotaxis response regulator CheB
VVDDSAAARGLVAESLANEVDIEVVGLAANGRIALDKIATLHPDVVTLDIEMPELDGFRTLEVIRRRHPEVAVIVFSSLSAPEASAALDALALGAREYVAKPARTGSTATAVQNARDELAPRIRELSARSRRASGLGAGPNAGSAGGRRRASTKTAGRVDAVVIAASTGGPNALHVLVPALPANLAVPVFVVQHMPEDFTRLLAERLNTSSAVKVKEAVSGASVRPGEVWVAPGGRHMVIRRRLGGVELQLNDDPPENSCRPAADPLFRSAVSVYGSHVLGIVLTGMGSDGLRGSEAVVHAGGQLLAQDEASSAVWGMPGEVVRAGLAHAVLPIDRVATEITRRTAFGRSAVPRSGDTA